MVYCNSGFEVADKGCCGTGSVEVAILCNQLDFQTCTDASKYVFFDSYHSTTSSEIVDFPLNSQLSTRIFIIIIFSVAIVIVSFLPYGILICNK